MKLQNKSIIITGASSGIGEGLALELAKFQNRMWLIGQDASRLEAVARRCTELGSEARWESVDLKESSKVQKSFANFLTWSGRCDALVMSAGIAELSLVDALNYVDARNMMEVNYFGCLHWIEQVLPLMRQQGKGLIAGISAMASYRGLPQGAFYGASKAALSNCLESLRLDLSSENIQVSTILPGFVDTPMARKFDYSMPVVWSPERAAIHIRKQLEKGKAEIAFPGSLALLMKLVRLMPNFIFDPIFKRVAKEAHKKGNALRKS